MLLQRSRIVLCLLENALHDRVLQNRCDFRVPLDALHGLLLSLALTRAELCLHSLLLLLSDLPRVFATLVVSHRLLAYVKALVELLHHHQSLCFAEVGTDELGVSFDGLVAILNRRWEAEEFDEACCTVGVSAGVFWGALNHLRVRFDRSRPIRLLELGIAELACLFGLFGIDVGILVGLDLCLFSGAQLGQDFGCAVLGLRLLVVDNRVCEIAELLICSANACECPGMY
ncbi:hypothetical protein P154DRAFT_259096 [Amniculicola lignicola CBS 123094]|uniref:Uncharacterized protein n=1 Tax=Amniculicola lignicola CBS 123094 TaxID=1392246 RepID=A0A6A5WXG7_9PLEO|nr:hypothetical protein P154DRAFT_259096 [Amniculicola lignicola CBS 123094]